MIIIKITAEYCFWFWRRFGQINSNHNPASYPLTGMEDAFRADVVWGQGASGMKRQGPLPFRGLRNMGSIKVKIQHRHKVRFQGRNSKTNQNKITQLGFG